MFYLIFLVVLESDENRFNKDFGYFEAAIGTYTVSAPNQTLLWGILMMGVVLACVAAGPVGSRFGRRVGLSLCAVFSIIGPIVQVVAPNLGVAAFGRFISGAGIGFAANFCIMYWAEVTPAHLRGMIV